MTEEHKNYLKKIKINNLLVKVCQLSIIIIFIVIWQLLANYKIINTFIFSSPLKVLNTVVELHKTNNLYNHIFITVYETLISFGLGTILGIILATLLWWDRFLNKVLDPYLTILNSLPKVALGPIIIIWAGAGMKSIILMALLISLIITTMTVYQGFENTDKNKINLMKSFRAKKYQVFFKLVFPNSLKVIVGALKINISMSLIGLLPPVGENFIV